MTAPTDRERLADRVRPLLAAGSPGREVPMFGGLSFMVDDRMAVFVRRDGGLLVRADPERSRKLLALEGTRAAEMGGRAMGPEWIDVAAEAIATDERLAFWIQVALDHHGRSREVSQETRPRGGARAAPPGRAPARS